VPRGGPGMLELRNVLNIKEFSEKLRSKKSEKVLSYPLSQTSVWKKFWDVLFSEKNIPPPRDGSPFTPLPQPDFKFTIKNYNFCKSLYIYITMLCCIKIWQDFSRI
jgi:hypothetical protein